MFFVDHLYFLIGLYFFLILWLPLFIFNKKGRKWMLFMSLGGMILGLPFIQHMYISDWWHPNFIFSYPIKIEDLIFGFSLVGSISSIYSLLRSTRVNISITKVSIIIKIIVFFLVFGSMFLLFYVFKINSFLSSVVGSSIGVLAVAIKKPWFINYGLMTGFTILLVIIPIYLFCIYLDPNFIQNQWQVEKLSGITFLLIPIEEYIFYIFAALGMSALQEWVEF